MGTTVSLLYEHIPERKLNAQMMFCKLVNWRIPALRKPSLFVFISSTCPNISLPLPFPVFLCDAMCSSGPLWLGKLISQRALELALVNQECISFALHELNVEPQNHSAAIIYL